jgi:hypothetical protein
MGVKQKKKKSAHPEQSWRSERRTERKTGRNKRWQVNKAQMKAKKKK